MSIELVEKPRSRAQPTSEILPIGGINTDVPSTELSITESPRSKNIMFHKFGARTRNGLNELGALTNITGIPVGIWQYIKLNQTRHVVLLTTNGIFYYDSATDAWVDRNGGAGVTIDAVATDFGDGAFFPQGGTDMFIMTNGIDPIIKWAGSTAASPTGDVEVLGGLASPAITAKFVRPYRDYMLLINCQVAGTNIPQRLIWSDIANPEVYSGGHAGQYDILSKGTEIKAHNMLRGILDLYMEDSIVAFVHVGGRDVFRWEIVVPETGLAGKRTVAEFGDFQIFLGWDNVYIFDGTQHLQPITENKIGRGLIEAINYERIDNAFAVVDKKFGLYSLFVPEGTDYWPRTRWVYDIQGQTWAKYRYELYDNILDADGNAAGLLGGTLYRNFTGLRWSDLVGDWANQTWRWSQRDVSKDAPRIALIASGDATAERTGDVEGGDVLVETVVAKDDNGTTIDSSYETKDFQVGDTTRFTTVEFEAIGNSVDLSYSTDEGETWTAISTVELDNATYQRYKVYFDVLAQRCRFRFRNNTNDEFFDLRKWRFWAIARS